MKVNKRFGMPLFQYGKIKMAVFNGYHVIKNIKREKTRDQYDLRDDPQKLQSVVFWDVFFEANLGTSASFRVLEDRGRRKEGSLYHSQETFTL